MSCVNARGRGGQHRQQAAADLRFRARAGAGQEHRRLPQRERALPHPRQSCRRSRGSGPRPSSRRPASSAFAMREQPARRQRGPSRELRRGRAHGAGPGLLGRGPDAAVTSCVSKDRPATLRHRDGRPAHPQRHPGRSWPSRAATRASSSRRSRSPKGSTRWRTSSRA